MTNFAAFERVIKVNLKCILAKFDAVPYESRSESQRNLTSYSSGSDPQEQGPAVLSLVAEPLRWGGDAESYFC